MKRPERYFIAEIGGVASQEGNGLRRRHAVSDNPCLRLPSQEGSGLKHYYFGTDTGISPSSLARGKWIEAVLFLVDL